MIGEGDQREEHGIRSDSNAPIWYLEASPGGERPGGCPEPVVANEGEVESTSTDLELLPL